MYTLGGDAETQCVRQWWGCGRTRTAWLSSTVWRRASRTATSRRRPSSRTSSAPTRQPASTTCRTTASQRTATSRLEANTQPRASHSPLHAPPPPSAPRHFELIVFRIPANCRSNTMIVPRWYPATNDDAKTGRVFKPNLPSATYKYPACFVISLICTSSSSRFASPHIARPTCEHVCSRFTESYLLYRLHSLAARIIRVHHRGIG